MSSWGAAMCTSRIESSAAGGVDSEAVRECGQTPTAMEEGTGAKPGSAPGHNVLHSSSLRSLVGEECLQLLRCSICSEFFNIPIVLPCGHTFCLQCLTDMCKFATRPCGASLTGTEALIGCPTCRVQIFATPILQRNVTCNFIIQTLVDTLRNRKMPGRTSVSVNTERSLLGPPVRAVSEEALCGVLQDLNRLSASLRHRSVVDDAFFEIEQIRSSHLGEPDKASGDRVHGSLDSGPTPRVPAAAPVGDMLPAFFTSTASDSSTTPGSALLQQQSAGEAVTTGLQQNPAARRCYAAVLTSGIDRLGLAASTPTSGKSSDSGFRGTGRPSFCCPPTAMLAPLAPHVSAFHSAPPPFLSQFGSSSSPGPGPAPPQNRNRNNPRAAACQSSCEQTVTSPPPPRKQPPSLVCSSRVSGHKAHPPLRPYQVSRRSVSFAQRPASGCQQTWESLHQLAASSAALASRRYQSAHTTDVDHQAPAVKLRKLQGCVFLF